MLRSVCLVAVLLTVVRSSALRRSKRDIFELCDVVAHFTKRDCMDFVGYGCYCGLGGGGMPQDDIDRCCKAHDQCYGNDNACDPKYIKYKLDNYKCPESGQDACQQKSCRCDIEFGKCLKKHKDSFNKERAMCTARDE